MRCFIIIIQYCLPLAMLFAQQSPAQRQQFVIKRDRVFDNEKIFTDQQLRQLDSIVVDCWAKGIADIAIITIDERHTNAKDFDNYVFNNLTSYALGEYGKNNGIIIALSKKLRRIRVENGYGIEKVLSNETTKEIVDEEFIPKFKEGDYFAGTLNGLNAIITQVEKVMREEDFTDASAIFQPSLYKKIRDFILENGSPKTFRNLDVNNPSYKFASMEVFLGPSRQNSYLLKDFLYDDYYEMTIRHPDGSHYQFVYFEDRPPEQTFIHKKMQEKRVYWWHPNGKFISTDVWPLLTQVEDEISQKAGAHKDRPVTAYEWVLKQEFHPMERIFMDVDHSDTLCFANNQIFINGEQTGAYNVSPNDRLLTLKIEEGKRPSFAIFPMDNRYNYRYLFSPDQRKLYLVPLDEKEGNDLICVEGCTLLFEILEK